jgi:hypothetical protein
MPFEVVEAMAQEQVRITTPPDPRTGERERVLDPLEFVHAMCRQVPDPRQHLVRYPCVVQPLSGTRCHRCSWLSRPRTGVLWYVSRHGWVRCLLAMVTVRRLRAVTRFSPMDGGCGTGSPASA